MEQKIIRIDLNGVNCYLGKQGESFILFDTGGHLILDKVFDDRREKLLKALENAGCNSENLKLIVLTHGDNDHTSSAAYIRNKFQVKVAMHASDLELVKNPTVENAMANCKYRSLVYKIIFRIMYKQITKMNNKILSDFEKFTPDILLNDGDSLSKYGFDAKILHKPGHTAGSIGILISNGDLISGDIFANIKNPIPAPNAEDFNLLYKSINSLKAMNIKTVYPGHGEPFLMSRISK